MSFQLGKDAKAYRLTTGPRATWSATVVTGYHSGPAPASNFAEMPQVRNIKIPLEKSEADVTTRGNNGWKARVGTLKDATIDIDMVYDRADADVKALLSAWLLDTTVPLAFLDGDKATVGVMGLWADFQVLKAEKGEELENGQMITFTVAPTLTAVPPEWVVVASGS